MLDYNHQRNKGVLKMSFKIGFTAETKHENNNTTAATTATIIAAPRKSVVQVHFPVRGLTCAYYNDAFDLHRGDIVYVDGKLEGLRGRVVDVSYTFKIKLSDYKRVIGKADTNVNGNFHMAGSHLVSFDPTAMPFEKVITWFKAPAKEDDEFVSGSDDTAFRLDDLKGMNVSGAIAERGHDYYIENKVVYLSIDGTHGHAIVDGSEPYEVEFTYQSGEIRGLTCSCFCSYNCKHEFAAMLQLRETLELIEKHYGDEYERTGYFAAITKTALFSFVIDGKETGKFTL